MEMAARITILNQKFQCSMFCMGESCICLILYIIIANFVKHYRRKRRGNIDCFASARNDGKIARNNGKNARNDNGNDKMFNEIKKNG